MNSGNFSFRAFSLGWRTCEQQKRENKSERVDNGTPCDVPCINQRSMNKNLASNGTSLVSFMLFSLPFWV